MSRELVKCDHCGEVKECEYLPDPLLDEIHDEVEESWWCDMCYSYRADEV